MQMMFTTWDDVLYADCPKPKTYYDSELAELEKLEKAFYELIGNYNADKVKNFKFKETPKSIKPEVPLSNGLRVKDVIINEPAVVVRFTDGTKVVSKVDEQDIFSPEMGLLLGICKKLLGSAKTHELLDTYVWNRGDK